MSSLFLTPSPPLPPSHPPPLPPSLPQAGRRTPMATMLMMAVCSAPQGQDSSMAPPSPLTMWLGVGLTSWTAPSSSPRMGSNWVSESSACSSIYSPNHRVLPLRYCCVRCASKKDYREQRSSIFLSSLSLSPLYSSTPLWDYKHQERWLRQILASLHLCLTWRAC